MDAFMATTRRQFGLGEVAGRLDAVLCDEHGFAQESSGQIDRALQTYQRCIQLARGSDARFISVYVLYAARHCDADLDGGNVTCH